jgi:hypothetical protein
MGIGCYYSQKYNKIEKVKKENIKNEINKDNNTFKKYNSISKKKVSKKHEIANFIIANDSYIFFGYNNSFIIFRSNEVLSLVYSNKNNSIISYHIIDNKQIFEIRNAHQSFITNFSHFYESKRERDLIISVSADNNLKVWNYNDIECILSINKVYEVGYILSTCFLNYRDNTYFIISNNKCCGSLIFNLKDKKTNEIKDSFDNTVVVNCFYDKKTLKNYVITGNYGYVKSFDFENNKLYFKYSEYFNNDNNYYYYSILIYDKGKETHLIASNANGVIDIWDFHKMTLLKVINIIDNCELYCICLRDKDSLFIGCGNGKIILSNITNNKSLNIASHTRSVVSLKTINHPKFGECLISFSYDEEIKIWFLKSLNYK